MYNTLVTKISLLDAGGFVLKTQYNTEKAGLEKEISDTSGLVKREQIMMLRKLRLKVKYLLIPAQLVLLLLMALKTRYQTLIIYPKSIL